MTKELQELRLETINSKNEFFKMRKEWNDLLERSCHKSVFLTWEWQYTWWESYRILGSEKLLHIVAARAPNGTLLALLPLYRRRIKIFPGCSFPILEYIGSQHESPEYLDVICDTSLSSESLWPLYDLLYTSGVDGLVFSDMRQEATILNSLPIWAKSRNIFTQKRQWKSCPFISISGDFEDYLNSRSSNMRYNLRRKERKLNKIGKIGFRRIENEKEAILGIKILYELHRKRWSTRKGSSKFDDVEREKFHEKVVLPMLQSGFLHLYILEIDSKIVAMLYCFKYCRKVYYYQAGMDPQWDKLSVGMVLMGKVIQATIEDGCDEFDFLRGLENYKFHWTEQKRDTYILDVAFKSKAKNCFNYQEKLRKGKRKLKSLIKRIINKN